MVKDQTFTNGTAVFKVKEINSVGASLATEQTAGLMSAGDKVRLDTLSANQFLASTYPHQTNTLTYDGTSQEPVLSVYDTDKVALTGTMFATNAGTYTMQATPKTGYEWDESTGYTGTTPITIQWVINPAVLTNIPSQSGTLTYNGASQTPTWSNVVNGSVTITGDTSGTNYGQYTAVFTPNSNYIWSDDTRDPKNVNWTIERATVTKPVLSNTSKTYDGTTQSPALPTIDTNIVSKSGTDTAVNVGDYSITYSLIDVNNYTWSDSTVADVVCSWSIAKATVDIPVLSDKSKTYNTSSQSPTIPAVTSGVVTVSGETSATNAGTYTVTFSLDDTSNYEWSDHTTADKDDTWTIAKAEPTLTVSKNSISLDATSLTDTFTITYVGDGTLSVTSSDTNVATVSSISNNSVTVSAVNSGSCNVSINSSEGDNYNGGVVVVSTVVELLPAMGNALNTYTWSQIKQISEAGQGNNYFSVGDRKAITLNGKMGDYLTLSNKVLYVYILDFNHTEGTKGNLNGNHIVFGGFKSALSSGIDLCLCDWSTNKTYGGYTGNTSSGYTNYNAGSKHFRMNRCDNASGNYGGNYGGWKGCDLRYDILGATSTQPTNYNVSNATSRSGYDATSSTITSPVANTFMAALPSDLRAVLKLRTHWADNTGGGSSSSASSSVIDACFLLSEKEVFGSNSYQGSTDAGYDTQFAYYVNGNSKVKYNHQSTSTAVYWWESSPIYSSANRFCFVYYTGDANLSGAYNAIGVAPGFIV